MIQWILNVFSCLVCWFLIWEFWLHLLEMRFSVVLAIGDLGLQSTIVVFIFFSVLWFSFSLVIFWIVVLLFDLHWFDFFGLGSTVSIANGWCGFYHLLFELRSLVLLAPFYPTSFFEFKVVLFAFLLSWLSLSHRVSWIKSPPLLVP